MIGERARILSKKRRLPSNEPASGFIARLSCLDLVRKYSAVVLISQFFFCSSPSLAAQASFYTLNEKWEKANLAGQTKDQAVEDEFGSVLSKQTANLIGPPPAPAIKRTLAEIMQTGNLVEIEMNQTLFVKSTSGIIKFVATDEGIAAFETVSADTLAIFGSNVGSTFAHVWDAEGRHTFALRVRTPTFIPSRYHISQIEAFEKSRSFKFKYANSRSASYSGDKFSIMDRNSLDFTQSLALEGDTPYGALAAYAQTQKAREKTLLTDAQVSLKDGKIGPYKNFNLFAGDTGVQPDLMVLQGARVRGVRVDHWDQNKRVSWTGFHGREQSSIIGTLTPGVVGKRTLNSYLSGGVMDFKMNDQARFKTGIFSASGRSRADELNRKGYGVKSDIDLGPHVKFANETDFDNEHFAQRHSFTTTFERLRIRNEWRDISKKFFSMVGGGSLQGEIGHNLEVTANPFDFWSFGGSLDVFRDRLIPNPDDIESVNIHTDLSSTLIPWENASLIFNFQDLDDTGRLGPSRQRATGLQYNQRFNVFGHRATFFSRYQNRGNRLLTNPTLNYLQNQVVLGLYTQIFRGINFSLQEERNGVKEPNINRFTRPRALTYTFDYSHRIGDTPFFMDARLRIRDEEDTESTSSFMSGEDSTEISGGIYYREYEDLRSEERRVGKEC